VNRIQAVVLGSAALSLLAQGAGAHTFPRGAEFAGMLRKADFIFEGVVTSVQYKSSRPAGPQGASLPHTFVTFAIEKVYLPVPNGRGAPDSRRSPRTLTLRFLGGATERDDRFLEVGGSPLFDVGDRDILLVEGNTRSGCPLTECALGRFRLIDGLVYSDQGDEVDLTSDGDLAFGPPHRLREVDANTVGGHILEQMVVESLEPADRDGESTGGGDPVGGGDIAPGRHLADWEFDRLLTETLAATLGDRELERPRRLVSADIADDFTFVERPQARPDFRGARASIRPIVPSTPEERLELEKWIENGGDPRVPR